MWVDARVTAPLAPLPPAWCGRGARPHGRPSLPGGVPTVSQPSGGATDDTALGPSGVRNGDDAATAGATRRRGRGRDPGSDRMRGASAAGHFTAADRPAAGRHVRLHPPAAGRKPRGLRRGRRRRRDARRVRGGGDAGVAPGVRTRAGDGLDGRDRPGGGDHPPDRGRLRDRRAGRGPRDRPVAAARLPRWRDAPGRRPAAGRRRPHPSGRRRGRGGVRRCRRGRGDPSERDDDPCRRGGAARRPPGRARRRPVRGVRRVDRPVPPRRPR